VIRPEDLRPTYHASQQMTIRSVTLLEIAEALNTPETTYLSPQHPDRLTILGRTLTGRRLKIVVPAAEPHVIITVADRGQER
jgi:hypothetical protein